MYVSCPACAFSLLKCVVVGAAALGRLAARSLYISAARWRDRLVHHLYQVVYHHSLCVTKLRDRSGQAIVPSSTKLAHHCGAQVTCAPHHRCLRKPTSSTLRQAPALDMHFVAPYDGSGRDVARAEAVLCDHITALMSAAQQPVAQAQQRVQADKFVQQHTLR